MRYCYNDVYILAKAMHIFEKEFETMTDVCLLEVSFYLMYHIILFFFQESTTAASAAALVFRRNHLDPEKPIVLDVKPSVSIKCSVISQKYLAWFSKKENVSLSMSTTYGEEKVNHLYFRFKINLFFQIGKYRVDGFVSPCEKYPDGLVIEFFVSNFIQVTKIIIVFTGLLLACTQLQLFSRLRDWRHERQRDLGTWWGTVKLFETETSSQSYVGMWSESGTCWKPWNARLFRKLWAGGELYLG